MSETKEIVLIFHIGSLGDTVISIPCFREIARRHPDATRYLLTNYNVGKKSVSAAAMLAPTGLIDGTVEYPMHIRRPIDILKLYYEIKKIAPTILYYLLPEKKITHLFRHYAFFRICGINKISGIPWSRNLRVPKEISTGTLWESEASRLLRTIKVNTGPAPPVDADRALNITCEERSKAGSILKQLNPCDQFIAISMGGKVAINNWGNKKWTEFLSKLCLEYPGLGAVFIGSADERDRNESISKIWNGPKLNSCGLLSPRETAALIENARLFIGHDTGTLHLAAAVGTSVIGIYSARELPGKWFTDRDKDIFFYKRIECLGCEYLEIDECRNERLCITAIDPDDIVAAVKSKLSSY